jgi:hypothetical protein
MAVAASLCEARLSPAGRRLQVPVQSGPILRAHQRAGELDAVDATTYFETRSLPALTRSYPRHFTFYVAHPIAPFDVMPETHQTSKI